MTGLALLTIVLLVAAFVLFVLTAFNVASARVSLLGLGLACWVLSVLMALWK